jgi:hypothetical protein
MSDQSPRALLTQLHARLHAAFEADDAPTDEQIKSLIQEVTRVSRVMEMQSGPRLPRIRRGPAESPTVIEPPTFSGPKKRL